MSAGATTEDADELQEIIEHEPPPKDKKLGRRTLEFIGKMSGKAVEGIMTASAEAVTKAIMTYYGMG